MKVSRIKELLAQYPDDTELLIAWNDKENLEHYPEKITNETWEKIVETYEDSDLDGFYQDCLIIKSDVLYELKKEAGVL